jgi:hypothetical protein
MVSVRRSGTTVEIKMRIAKGVSFRRSSERRYADTREMSATTNYFSCNRLSGEASDIVSALLLLTRIVAEY